MKKQPNILVVDDYLLNQEVIKEMLEMLGCQVDLADGGKQAISQCRSKNYDLILMDIQMPEMDGVEAFRQLKELDSMKDTMVVALTANALQGDREKYISEGMNDYISKPVRFEDIEKLLGKYFQ